MCLNSAQDLKWLTLLPPTRQFVNELWMKWWRSHEMWFHVNVGFFPWIYTEICKEHYLEMYHIHKSMNAKGIMYEFCNFLMDKNLVVIVQQ